MDRAGSWLLALSLVTPPALAAERLPESAAQVDTSPKTPPEIPTPKRRPHVVRHHARHPPPPPKPQAVPPVPEAAPDPPPPAESPAPDRPNGERDFSPSRCPNVT